MRILFVTNRYPHPGNPGSSPCIAQQEQALRRLGHEVDVLFVQSEKSRLEYLRGMLRVFWEVQFRGRYDLVHAHYGTCGLVARSQWRRPVLVTYRGSDVMAPRERPIARLVARWVDGAVVMSEEMKAVLGRTDTQVIPYGIDTGIFHPQDREEARRTLGLDPRAPLVLFPYDPMRRVKRYDRVEAAMALVRRELPAAQTIVVHDRPPEMVAAYMNACDSMVLASDSEGAPVAVREAMACNLPVVSLNVGDVAQVIGGTPGCHIVGDGSEELARALVTVLRERRRTNGEIAVRAMSTDASAAQIARLYEDLLQGGASRRLSPSESVRQ